MWLLHCHGHGQQTTMRAKRNATQHNTQQHHFNVSLKAFKIKPFRNETKLKPAHTNGNDDENANNSTINISNNKMAIFSLTRSGFIAYSFGF